MTRKENKKKISEKQSGPSIEALFTELTEIIARLRAPDGCPWDREQTPETVRKYILEETYELAEAIDGGRPEAVCEELGDTIFLLLFVAGIYEERHADFLRNALEGIAEKMIRRHPHIFGDLKVETSEEVTANWQAIKAGEAMKKGKRQSVLGNLPRALPALQRAFRMGERASRVGFDWADASDVWAKVKEEERELRCALESGNTEEIVMEMGDLLFTLANMSRLLGINPEEVLQHTLNRFERRFHAMEDILGSEGHEISHCTAEEMNEVWERAKSES